MSLAKQLSPCPWVEQVKARIQAVLELLQGLLIPLQGIRLDEGIRLGPSPVSG